MRKLAPFHSHNRYYNHIQGSDYLSQCDILGEGRNIQSPGKDYICLRNVRLNLPHVFHRHPSPNGTETENLAHLSLENVEKQTNEVFEKNQCCKQCFQLYEYRYLILLVDINRVGTTGFNTW